MRPGFDVILRDAPVPRSAPTDVDTAFVVGPTERGPLDATLILSPKALDDVFGGDIADSHVHATVETAFAEGVSRVYIKRVVGPGADVATIELDDDAAAATLAVDAISPGAWAHRYEVAITSPGAGFVITITDSEDGDKVIEQSPEFATKAEAVAWGEGRELFRVRSLAPATLPADAAAAPLAGGDSDHAGITNAERVAALDALSRWLGPGQVAMPGATTAALHSALLAHAAATNRRAVCDLPNDPNEAVVRAAAEAVRDDVNAKFGAAFGPWDIIPGRLAGTTRVVPPCGRVLGTIARLGAATGNPNLPAAGSNGEAQYVIGLTQVYTDDEYESLNEAGCNMSRTLFAGSNIQIYGFRTLVDPEADPRWVEFSGSRTVMYVTSQANAIMANFAFDQIDGQGHKFSELEGALTGVCLDLFNPPKNALYGDSPQDAFSVNAGRQVNTPESVQGRNLRAVISLRTSPFAEHVVTEIVRRMVTEEV